jgi:hypothetical protein
VPAEVGPRVAPQGCAKGQTEDQAFGQPDHQPECRAHYPTGKTLNRSTFRCSPDEPDIDETLMHRTGPGRVS